MNSLIKNVATSKYNKLIVAAISTALAVALPQLVHLIGGLSATDAIPGIALLPMHIPVFVAGLLCGPVVGLIVGALSPLLSTLTSGMPMLAILPFMIFELATYGAVMGLLRNTKLPVILKVVAAQLAGRAVYAVVIVAAVYLFNSNAVTLTDILSTITVSLLGIVLQWLLIPLIAFRIKSAVK